MIEVDKHGIAWIGQRTATIADYKARVAELEAACTDKDRTIVEAAKRIAGLEAALVGEMSSSADAALAGPLGSEFEKIWDDNVTRLYEP